MSPMDRRDFTRLSLMAAAATATAALVLAWLARVEAAGGAVEDGGETVGEIGWGERGEVKKLEVGGDTFKFDESGPVVVNTDGTLRRIANWANMSDRERETAMRRLKDRNKQRTDALKEEQQGKGTAKEGGRGEL